MSETPVRIFISYTRKDNEFVDRLEADLVVRGFNVWVDRRGLEPGRQWAEDIERAIDRCQTMLVVLTPEATESEWVRREFSYAQDTKKTVIPLLLRPVSKVPIRLNGIQWVDFQAGYDEGLRDLLIALATPAPQQAATPLPIEIPPDQDAVASFESARPAPPPPDPSLNDLYRQAVAAETAGDLERASVMFEQLLKRAPEFGKGSAAEHMAAVTAKLHPLRVQRLRERARTASEAGEWRQVIGAWQALIALEPDDAQAHAGLRDAYLGFAAQAHRDGAWSDEIAAWEALQRWEPQDEEIRERIAIATTNQQWEWLYGNAQDFVKEGDLQAAAAQLRELWSKARYYGDPAGIAPQVGETVPPTYDEVQQAKRRQEADQRHQEEVKRRQQLEAQQAAEAARRREAEEKVEREKLEAAWQAYRARRATYRTKRLKSLAYVVGLCALGLMIVVGADLGLAVKVALGRGAIPTAFGTSQTTGYAIYAGGLVVAGLLAYGLGYRRALHPLTMTMLVIAGGVAGYALNLVPASTLFDGPRFFSFPFFGLIHVAPGNTGIFCLAVGGGYAIVGFVLAIIGLVVAAFAEDLGVGVAIGGGILVGSFAIGLIIAIPVAYLGWIAGGLVLGGIVGVSVGLVCMPSFDGLTVDAATGIALLVAAGLGLITWLVFGKLLLLDSSLVLRWFGAIAAGLVGGAAIGATLRIWLLRAKPAPRPKRRLTPAP